MLKLAALAAGTVIALPLSVMALTTATAGTSGAVLASRPALASAPTPLALRDIPPRYLAWYMGAAQSECPGLSWSVLAGIGKIETDHGRSRLPGVRSGANHAGAEGPMQFEPATFRRYAVDADPGRPVTPYVPPDAIYAAARMLCADGAPGRLRKAVFAYNHARWYVTSVLRWARRYARPASTARARIISYALAQLGKPYQWGATGPAAFDCSGLAMTAYRAAGITIPRTSQQQWRFGPKIPAAQRQPGDLAFYIGSDGTAAAPGHVGIVYTPTTMIVAPTTGQDVQIQPISQPGLIGFTSPLARH